MNVAFQVWNVVMRNLWNLKLIYAKGRWGLKQQHTAIPQAVFFTAYIKRPSLTTPQKEKKKKNLHHRIKLTTIFFPNHIALHLSDFSSEQIMWKY